MKPPRSDCIRPALKLGTIENVSEDVLSLGVVVRVAGVLLTGQSDFALKRAKSGIPRGSVLVFRRIRILDQRSYVGEEGGDSLLPLMRKTDSYT